MNEIDKIKEEVEQRLQQQQANKEFKDVGRVAQTKKEKSAYKIISSTLLRDIELDPVMAFNMIKKDTVWLPIDVQAERDRGNTSGAVYFKVKLRESLPAKPKNDRLFRSIYVLFLEKLQADLSNCFTVDEIFVLASKYEKYEIDEIVGEFMFPEYKSGSDEQKDEIKALLSNNPVFRKAFAESQMTGLRKAFLTSYVPFFKKLIREVFGAKFENMFFVSSDSAKQNKIDALEKEPVTEEQSKLLIEKIIERRESFVKANNEKIDGYKSMYDYELYQQIQNSGMSSFSKQFYKKNIEVYRKELIEGREKSVAKEVELFKQRIESAKPRPNNWDWFEVVKEKSTDVVDKPKNKVINTKTPLAYIKRTGGVKIDAITPNEIISQFGFSSVNYGNYVDDVWSKEHTSHFLGAVSDLGEILNFDIKKINQLGSLGIAFGAKGKAGALATYFPQTKDINLTKTNGDGSVAHEWGHYFDNVIVEKAEAKAINQFASEGFMPNEEIKALYKELMNFFYKGKEGITPKLKFRFYANNSDYATFSRLVNNSWTKVEVEIKSTIEETISQYDYLLTSDESVYSTQLRVLGYIIKSFGLEYYDVDIQLKTSYFYHKSAFSFFEYCYRKSPRETVKAGEKRTKYWTSQVELFARAWETVVLKKLTDKNRESNYLVADIPTDDIISADYFEPYPTGKETEYIESILDRIIEAVKRFYSIGDFKATSNVREDVFIELSKDSKEAKDKRGVKVEKSKEEKTVVFVEENKVVEEVKSEDVLKIFKDIVLESKSFDEAFDKVSNVQGVPREVSAFFFEKYNPNNKLDKHDTFLKFYTEVKGEKSEEPEESMGLEKRNIWIPNMTINKLKNLLSKSILTKDDVEDLKDFKYFLLTDKQSAVEKGFYKELIVNQKEKAYVLKDKFWLVNIDSKIKEFEQQQEEPEESIQDLIEGLEILLESLEGEEKKDLEDTIEGLKLLL